MFKSAFFLSSFFLSWAFISSCASVGEQKDGNIGGESRAISADFAADFFLPERVEECGQGKNQSVFRTSVPKAAVYINGEYHGLTPLIAADLIPGRYSVQIKKEGRKTEAMAIQVIDGISSFYYVELKIDGEENDGESKANGEAETIPQRQRPEEPEL